MSSSSSNTERSFIEYLLEFTLPSNKIKVPRLETAPLLSLAVGFYARIIARLISFLDEVLSRNVLQGCRGQGVAQVLGVYDP
jgi:hypothetical protein